jgi:trehalose/maltose hydrolase-like predicted phosphorylase
MSNGYYTNTVIKTPLPGSLRAGYHNAAYLSSNMNLRQMQQQQLGNRQHVNNAAMISLDRSRKNFPQQPLKRYISYYSD